MTGSQLDRVREIREQIEQATAVRDEAIREAIAAGFSYPEVATVAGVSRQRVYQIAPRAEVVRTPVHAQKNTPASVCVTDSDTVPSLPDTLREWRSGIASTRERRPLGRPTRFYDVETGRVVDESGAVVVGESSDPGTLADVLGAAAGKESRIYLTGPAPFDTSGGATQAEAVRAWALGDVPPGWRAGKHFLREADKPSLRFYGPHGESVTVMRAAIWWGETDASADVCAAAWRGLGAVLDGIPAFKGAGLGDTPSTAGRALWSRTIPAAGGYDVLSSEIRELLYATAGQGRRELRAPARPEVEQFTQVDGRFMYAALTWGMPVGEPRRWTGAEVDALGQADVVKVIRGRSRWRITCKVPADWAHVGLFMAPASGGGWCYPDKPGQVFTTWADGCEVWNALKWGWEPVIHEGLSWAEGKPLNAWTDALVAAWQTAQASTSPAGRLGAKALRSMLLYAVGGFAQRDRNETGSTPADQPDDVPDDVIPASVRRVGDSLTWERPAKVSEWTASKMHPEWSATIWARARVRLLDGPNDTGALHLPASSVIGFATDAIYLDGTPSWEAADDGKPGRFRVKGRLYESAPWPTSYGDLYALRDRSEA